MLINGWKANVLIMLLWIKEENEIRGRARDTSARKRGREESSCQIRSEGTHAYGGKGEEEEGKETKLEDCMIPFVIWRQVMNSCMITRKERKIERLHGIFSPGSYEFSPPPAGYTDYSTDWWCTQREYVNWRERERERGGGRDTVVMLLDLEVMITNRKRCSWFSMGSHGR